MRKHDGDPPVCVDCEHYRSFSDNHAQCYSDDCSTFDPVIGRQPAAPHELRTAQGVCGLTGRFFSPKREPTRWEYFTAYVSYNVLPLTFWACVIVAAVHYTKGWLW